MTLKVAVLVFSLGVMYFSYTFFKGYFYNNGMDDHLFGDSLYLDATIDAFDDLDDVESKTDIIVVAEKIIQDDPTILNNDEGRIDIAFTLSDFVVHQVIVGNDLQEGENFTLLENEAYNSDIGLTYHIEGYNLIKTGQKYLLFLTQESSDPYYLITGVNYGKVALEEEQTDFPVALENEDTEYAKEVLSKYQHQEQVRKEALEKYGTLIN